MTRTGDFYKTAKPHQATPMKTQALLNRVDRCLAACAAAAAASLATVPPSEATIVYSGPTNISIPLTTAGVYLNVVTGQNGTSPAAAPGWDINPFSSIALNWFAATPTSSSGYIINAPGGSSATLVDNLPLGNVISGASTFGFNNGSEPVGLTAFKFNSSENIIGFRFLNETTGILNYGWLQLYLGASFTDPARAIRGYAYENSGAAIFTPLGYPVDTPEPSTYALLSAAAMGAFGVRAWRRRKAA